MTATNTVKLTTETREEVVANSMLERWLEMNSGNESPTNYHRWSFISAVATILERNVWFQFGNKTVYPNMYVMLAGESGARKNGAVSPMLKVMRKAGYSKFSKQRTSKQQFLVELARGDDFEEALNAGPDSVDAVMIAAEEFLDFIGMGNLEFITLLTDLWDNKPKYEESYRKSEPVLVLNPTINILGGITPTNLKLSMPAEAGGIGFLSRTVLVYCEPSKVRITFPRSIGAQNEDLIAKFLQGLGSLRGEMYFSREGAALVDAIYQSFIYLEDGRLASYCSRRLEHLIKLCMVCAACRGQLCMTEHVVLEANSILCFTEETMHRAFGEFGRAKHSEAMHKIVQFLENKNTPCGIEELYKACSQDLDRFQDLFHLLTNLEKSDRIMKAGDLYIIKRVGAVERRRYANYATYIREAPYYAEYEESQRKLADMCGSGFS